MARTKVARYADWDYWGRPLPGFGDPTVVFIAAAGMAYGCLAAVYRASPAALVVILSVETVATLMQCAGSAFIIVGGGSIPALLRLALAVQLAQLGVAAIGWRTMATEDRLQLPSPGSVAQLVWRGLPFAMTGLVASVPDSSSSSSAA